MDKLRAAATNLADRAARSRPVAWLRATIDKQTDGGQGLAEYALILAGIAIVAIASLVFLGGTIEGLFWAPISEDFGEVLSRLGI